MKTSNVWNPSSGSFVSAYKYTTPKQQPIYKLPSTPMPTYKSTPTTTQKSTPYPYNQPVQKSTSYQQSQPVNQHTVDERPYVSTIPRKPLCNRCNNSNCFCTTCHSCSKNGFMVCYCCKKCNSRVCRCELMNIQPLVLSSTDYDPFLLRPTEETPLDKKPLDKKPPKRQLINGCCTIV